MAHFKTRPWLVAIVIIYLGCSAPSNRQVAPVIIDIQPFAGFSREMTNQVSNQIKEVYPHVIVLPELPLPPSAFYAPRNRFRADSIIKFLKDKTAKGHVSIGLTHKDISTTNGNVKDWGVMGLGYRPGNACVASTFRLNKEKVASQFYKVCIHELGHTSGLAHCTQPTCFMRDAEGGNPTDQEKAFCKSCSEFLSAIGWLLDKSRK